MGSNTYLPTIDQGAFQQFQDNFFALAAKTKAVTAQTGAVKFAPSKGKTTNMARMGKVELVEVAGRNPDKQYGDYALDNRQFTKRRFTRTITIDAKYDINELLKDPTSDILTRLDEAKERVFDRVVCSAAQGSVLVGDPAQAPSTITAATDGVKTVAGTSGISSTTINSVTQMFINNDVPMHLIKGSTLCITGKENTALMADDKFVSSLYIDRKPINDGVITQAGLYQVALMAGSDTNITVDNPVLDETVSSNTVRNCLVLAPESVLVSMEVALLDVDKSRTKVNSWDITIDLWINAMRTEGARVIIVTTTI